MSFASISVDYVTLTAKADTIEASVLRDVWSAVSGGMLMEGHKKKPMQALGYAGEQVGTLFYGYCSSGYILRASGTIANEVVEVLRGSPIEPHCTRFDAQVTYAFDCDQDAMLEEQRVSILNHQEANPAGRQPSLTLIDGVGKGGTVLIGKRSSEVYCRIYDKTREQKLEGPPWLWRWEIEAKGRRAQEALRMGMRSHTLAGAVKHMVDSVMAARGAWVPWELGALDAFPPLPRPGTNAEKQLNWLRNQVAGTVAELIEDGYREQVLDALGLIC